jgi:hypothetical protein
MGNSSLKKSELNSKITMDLIKNVVDEINRKLGSKPYLSVCMGFFFSLFPSFYFLSSFSPFLF